MQWKSKDPLFLWDLDPETARRRPNRHWTTTASAALRVPAPPAAGRSYRSSEMQNLPRHHPVAVFCFCSSLERFFPLRKATRSLLARLVVNIAISACTFISAVGLLQPAVQSALRWSADKPFGFVHLIALPSPFEFVLAFLLMDLTFYYWHLANHRVPFLWRFHNVHHTDPDLDVSTAFRFHFGEITLSISFQSSSSESHRPFGMGICRLPARFSG